MARIVHDNPRLLPLLAFALLLRSLVPEGFMPGNGRWVELCTMDGARTVWVAGDDHRSPGDMPQCPWDAALSAGAPLPESPHQVAASPVLPRVNVPSEIRLPSPAPSHFAARAPPDLRTPRIV